MGLEGGLNKQSPFTCEPNLKSADYYERLGLDRSASSAQITRAFRALAKIHHTDVGSGNLENAQLIGEAYEALGDDEKRAAYDEKHAPPERSATSPDTAAEAFGHTIEIRSDPLDRDQNGKIIIADRMDVALQKMGYENLEAFSRSGIVVPRSPEYQKTKQGLEAIAKEAGYDDLESFMRGGGFPRAPRENIDQAAPTERSIEIQKEDGSTR